MPSLFRRKPTEPEVAPVVEETDDGTVRRKSYTPSKRELGKTTPKRTGTGRRIEPAPANRREAYKRMKEKQRAERAEQRAGMMAGDERYLLPRDKGEERRLVRNIVDSRHTIGTWFFGGALLVLVGSSAAMPPFVQLGSTALWAVLAIAVIVDSFLIARRVKKLVGERFPKTTQRMGSLYMYGIMRGLTFRRMRVPKPQIEMGGTP